MPADWDWWDWERHHDHYWHWSTRTWPWDASYHLKCPVRRRYWPFGAPDFDVCTRDWHVHQSEEAPWCHRSCLSARVFIETGDEKNTSGKGTFKVIIDVHHFRAEELLVKVRNNDTVVLEGKQQDDRADKSALCITREFTRKYRLPRNYDATQATAMLSTDGILTIMVPAPPPLDDVERVVDVVQTGAYFGSDAAPKNNAIEDAQPEEQTSEEK